MISRLSDTSLDAFYYTLKTDAYDHSVWNDVTVSKAVQVVPGSLEKQPLFLSIDDTLVEKSGKYFELCSKLYAHAALVKQLENLETVCTARGDTALYGLAPARTGKRGRPRKRWDRIPLDEIALNEPQNGDWLTGIMPVSTNLWCAIYPDFLVIHYIHFLVINSDCCAAQRRNYIITAHTIPSNFA